MRRLSVILLLLGLALAPTAATSSAQAIDFVCGSQEPVEPALAEHLTDFAESIGLRYPRAFAGAVAAIQRTGRAPDCYLSKRQARAKGWSPGLDLCVSAMGGAIGAYPFENREGLLPRVHEGSYRIADLDYDCGGRGAKRLVYVRDAPGRWLVWVTLDHYKSYVKVPAPVRP